MYANLNDDPTAANCTNPAYANEPACNFEDETPWKIGLGLGISIALAVLIIYSCRKPCRHLAYSFLHAAKKDNVNNANDALELSFMDSGEGEDDKATAFLDAKEKEATQAGQPLMPSNENPFI
ncbi:MAG: hypothetical protein K0R66_1357 [Gammaproteobacteria bacterium]|nr:hypothetical protein [Gammaproteobacteria bacterium]